MDTEDRRKSDRRVSPAIGDFSLQERSELLAQIVYLKSVEKERNALRDELAALKAQKPGATHDPHEAWLTDPENVPFPGGLTPDLSQQPSAGVVLPEFIEHVKHARKELCRLEQTPWRIRQRLAQKLTDGIARINSSPVSTGVVDRWVDIAERLPEIGQHCLIKIPVCGRHEIEGATYEGEGVWAAAWCSSRGRGCAYKVSHWMATPSAQQKESE